MTHHSGTCTQEKRGHEAGTIVRTNPEQLYRLADLVILQLAADNERWLFVNFLERYVFFLIGGSFYFFFEFRASCPFADAIHPVQ